MNSSSPALNQNILDKVQQMKTNEIIAFDLCESEPTNGEGLTWKEVEDCEKKCEELAQRNNLYLPTKQDFDDLDLDNDGVLKLTEWTAEMEFETWKIAREQ